jgi:serine/threonine-protein kinase
VSRLAITPQSTAVPSLNDSSRDVAITPDGSRLVYIGANGTTLFVRPLDQLEATTLVRGVIALRDPFISPNGQWVGFFEGSTTLKKVPISGGPAVLIARLDSLERGATWAPDDTIIFGTTAPTIGLQRVSANGGVPVVLTRPDRTRGEGNHWWPKLLPGGQAVLCTIMATGALDAASIGVLDLRSGRLTTLLRGGTDAHYVSSGHLVYGAARTLRAVGFDPSRLIIVGASTPGVPQVATSAYGAVEVGLASDGTLVYVPARAGYGGTRTLVWVDRQGQETPLGAPPRVYGQPRLSPDGTRVAVQAPVDQNADIWIWDLARATLTRLTSDPASDIGPVWTSDSRRVVFSSNRAGPFNLFRQAADGTGAVERLVESPNPQTASSLSPDGTRLLFTTTLPKTGGDLAALWLDGPRQVLPLVQTSFNEGGGIVSPDGRWLAYEADDSGAFEIYVRPFPDVNRGRWAVSTNGGTRPVWGRSGRELELFYVAPDGALMHVAVRGGPAWTAGAPTKMLEGRYLLSTGARYQRNYDVAPDGQRFLMIKPTGTDATDTPPQIFVVQHFDEELKRLVPMK